MIGYIAAYAGFRVLWEPYNPPSQKKGKGMGYLIVFLGGGLGAALRHGVNLLFARLFGLSFPYGTLFENVSGSLAMGLLAGYFAFKGDASQHWRLFLTTGILGGYTTFSAFSLEVALLYEHDKLGLAALYALSSVIFSVAGLFAGLWLVRQFS
jgi:fluoride exporter